MPIKDVFVDAQKHELFILQNQQQQIKNLYKDASKIATKHADKLKGKDNISSILRTQYLNKMTDDLMESYNKINKQINAGVQGNMLQAAQAVVDTNNDYLKEMTLGIVDDAYSFVPEEVVQRLISGKMYKGKWNLSAAIWSDNKKILEDINYVVAQGVTLNKSTYAIAKDLEKYVNPDAKKDWNWSKVYPNTNKKIDYNAQRLARTMVSQAYQQSFVQCTFRNPFFEAYKWMISNSDRVCPVCFGRAHDDTYGLGPGIFPKDSLPMDHPNGMCSYRVVITKSMNQINKEIANWAKAPEGTYKDVDKFVRGIYGVKNKYEKKPELKFNELQSNWLSKFGYTPNKLPKDFDEWSHLLTSEDKKQLFADLDLYGDVHPFQKIKKWYEKELIKIEAAKETKKSVTEIKNAIKDKIDEIKYTLEKKNAAHWFKDSEDADKVLRKVAGENWQKLTETEKDGLFEYTAGSGFMNRPLRGYDYGWSKSDFKGIGKVSLNNEKSNGEKLINATTKAISQSSYDFDIWLQRGIESKRGVAGFLDVPEDFIEDASEDELKEKLLGKIVTDEGFTSSSTAKGKGFSGDIVNIFAPKGTKMHYAEPFSSFGKGSQREWDGIYNQYSFSNESEMIIQRGTSYRITKVEKSYSKLYIDIEVVYQKY